MAGQLAHRCDQHPDVHECPDVIVYQSDSGDFRIPIRDGGTSFLTITYCPWCGSPLQTANIKSDDAAIWIFMGNGAQQPSAVFSALESGEKWIRSKQLSGMLTKYPVNQPLYDYAIRNGWFNPKQEHQSLPQFIQRFTSASLEHYHYDSGNTE